MTDIKAYRKKHYSGLDADKANVTGAVGDSYAANDSGKQYYWNDSLNAWKTGLGYEFVPRKVDSADFNVGAFTTDGTWKVDGLDLTGIVPVGAVAVVIKVGLADDAANSVFVIRTDDGGDASTISAIVAVANIDFSTVSVISINADRLLDYYGANVAFGTINVAILGWYI